MFKTLWNQRLHQLITLRCVLLSVLFRPSIFQLASLTGNDAGLVRIHLDDQMDAKSLLGAYVCTTVPGEFVWQPGPLTQVGGGHSVL